MGFLSFRLLIIFFLSVIIARAPLGDAWGKEGHIMACKIAEPYLTEKTLKAVKDLLPEIAGGELSTMCPWADQVRFRYRWASPLHYINTPGVCNYKYSKLYPEANGGRHLSNGPRRYTLSHAKVYFSGAHFTNTAPPFASGQLCARSPHRKCG